MPKKPEFTYHNTFRLLTEAERHANHMISQGWHLINFQLTGDSIMLQWRRELRVVADWSGIRIFLLKAALTLLALGGFAAAFHHMMNADARALCDRTDKADVCAQAGVRP